MNIHLKRALTYAGYPALYLAAMGLFFHVTFPDERLKDRIETEFNSRKVMGDDVRLEVGHASPSWFNGIELEDVRLIDTKVEAERALASSTSGDSKGATTGSKSPAPAASASKPGAGLAVVTSDEMMVDELTVSVSLLSALMGTVAVSFDAEAFGGTVDGRFRRSEEQQAIQLELEEVGVGGFPLLKDLVGLPMRGSLSGTVDVVTPQQKLALAEGTLHLTISDLRVGDGKAQILKTIALPMIDVGTVELEAEVAAGVLRLVKLQAGGKDLDVEADGRIRLRDPLERSLLELNVRFRFSDSYKNRNDMTRGLFGTGGVPGLLELDPKVKRSKREDGYYAWRASGLLTSPHFVPESAARTPGVRRGARPARR